MRSAGGTAATNGGQRVGGRLDVIRYRVETQPIITDPASIFRSRKSRNINMTTLAVGRRRTSPQKSRDVGVDRVRRRRVAVRIANDAREQRQQNGRLSFGGISLKVPPTSLTTDCTVRMYADGRWVTGVGG